ncbi:MAG: hypothetical protein KatS3mg111_2643 [Pirellulaceae bacterium]|nr:MAG: hypothetical protein KatS3mg111_2643 [Pirellulaceae bacterium]
MRKKLIEVALPLEAINKASAREKSIRHGQPSTVHLWWGQRERVATLKSITFLSPNRRNLSPVGDKTSPSIHHGVVRRSHGVPERSMRIESIRCPAATEADSFNRQPQAYASGRLNRNFRVRLRLTVKQPRARRPFRREPNFGATSVNYSFSELLPRSEDFV